MAKIHEKIDAHPISDYIPAELLESGQTRNDLPDEYKFVGVSGTGIPHSSWHDPLHSLKKEQCHKQVSHKLIPQEYICC